MKCLIYALQFLFIFPWAVISTEYKKCKSYKNALYGILITFVGILLVFNPGMAIAFNGFAYAQARYTFVLMPVAALLVAVEWDRLTRKKEFSFIGLGLGLISSLYIVIKAYNKASLEVRSYDAEIIILQICFAFLLLVMFFGKISRGVRL